MREMKKVVFLLSDISDQVVNNAGDDLLINRSCAR